MRITPDKAPEMDIFSIIITTLGDIDFSAVLRVVFQEGGRFRARSLYSSLEPFSGSA